jgi:threonine/homoserine/homoserine lactone efflux protein
VKKIIDGLLVLSVVGMAVLNHKAPETAHRVMLIISGPLLCWMGWRLWQKLKEPHT